MSWIESVYLKLEIRNIGQLAWGLSLFSSVFSPSAVLAATPLQKADVLPANLRCRDALAAQLEAWQISGEAFRDVPEPGGALALRFPTSKVGVWALLATGSENSLTLTRVTGSAVEKAVFDESCSASTEVRKQQTNHPPAKAFTDDDLSSLLRAHRAGVIYIWSPHMPLSVDGYSQLEAAARELGLPLTVVLNPQADAHYAESVARDQKLPEAALRPLWSSELFFRNAGLHAPSVVVYCEGHLLGLALPGYRDTAAYRQIIEHQLEQNSQPHP